MILNSQEFFYKAFEKRVEEIPASPAIVFRDNFDCSREITYRELKENVKQMADRLRNAGAKPGDIIGVIVESTIETVINVLGIIEIGGVFMPIDPENSKSRIRSKLGNLGASMLLTAVGEIQKFSSKSFLTSRLIKGKPFLTRPRAHITDLDQLPIPDRSLVNYEKYMQYLGQTMCKNYIALQATRGCPYNCAYCHKIWPKTHVFRSAENIFSELKIYYDMGVRRFSFVDDVFNLNIKNSSRFFQLIIENELDLQLFFPAGLRGDILTKEYIDLMFKAGTMELALALETASPRLQKLIGKNLNIEKLRENMEYICEKYPHIILEVFTMTGFPTETKEEALMTLEFVKSVKWIDFPYMSIVRIYPNTDMEKLAITHGISKEAITNSETRAYNEIPETLPFEKSFMLKYKSDFLNKYFLSKERLLSVLPHQMKLLSEEELVRKYKSYLPLDINRLTDLLELVGIKYEDLGIEKCVDEGVMSVPHLNEKMKKYHGEKMVEKNALKVLLLDLSQLFSTESYLHFDLAEVPLGLMYILTYLAHHFGGKVRGKIAKARVDFDNYTEMKRLLDEFKPQVIGIRTLTIYKKFFHKTVAQIRQWGITVPIICGGPYATGNYTEILQDRNIDLVVLGEGEVTFCQLIREFMENDSKLPTEDVLRDIPGLAFIPGSEKNPGKFTREPGKLHESIEHILKEIAEARLLNLAEIDAISEDEEKQIFEFNIKKKGDSYDF
jgi:radical SAM superfamily enzyme YgiQ (UPF0313 family)